MNNKEDRNNNIEGRKEACGGGRRWVWEGVGAGELENKKVQKVVKEEAEAKRPQVCCEACGGTLVEEEGQEEEEKKN